MKNVNNRGWFLLFIIATMTALFMGILLVWLGIGRTDLAYEIRLMRLDFENHAALKSKLEVERERLLTPYELSKHAARLAIREAQVNQIRRLPEPRSNFNRSKKSSYASSK